MSGLTSKVKDGWARWKLAHFFLRDIQDVDTSSTPPADGDTLVWVDADKKWEPGTEAGGFGRMKWWHDSWDVTDASVTVYTMTFSARDQAAIVHLNGLILREGTDYTLDYPTGVITLTAGQTSVGDVLGVRYVTSSGAPAPSPTGGAALLGSNTQTLPGGTNAGDTVILFTAIPASRAVDSLNGYTDRGSCTVTHVANSGTLTYTLHVLTKVVTSSSDVPTYTGVGSGSGGQDIVWGVYTFPGSVTIADTKTDTVADDTSGSTPAVTVGSTTVRAWVTISNLGTLNTPARGGDFSATVGTDIDLTFAVDPDRTASPTTETVTAGWMLATVAIR